MRQLILLTALALAVASTAGCHTCRRLAGGWFNRGGPCQEALPPDCPPGMPRATMMIPSTTQVLPGPMEVAPIQ